MSREVGEDRVFQAEGMAGLCGGLMAGENVTDAGN